MTVYIKCGLNSVVNILNAETKEPVNSVAWYPKRRLFNLLPAEYLLLLDGNRYLLIVKDGRIVCYRLAPTGEKVVDNSIIELF
jgi:hypothetical protein